MKKAPGLQLERPLIVFDLETTGLDPANDRIVEIGLVKLRPGGARETKTWLVDPERPIPAAATAVHGIRDEDVAGAPTFAQLAPELLAVFDGADLSGFNLEKFDVPVLRHEFARAGVTYPTPETRTIDTYAIYRRREPRDLATAVDFYCDRPHAGSHRAEADAVAAADVLLGQLARYDDLPRSVDGLHDLLHPTDPTWIDGSGKLAWRADQAVLTFGKHRDKPLGQLVEDEPDYLRWILDKDFPEDTKSIIAAALEGRLPSPTG